MSATLSSTFRPLIRTNAFEAGSAKFRFSASAGSSKFTGQALRLAVRTPTTAKAAKLEICADDRLRLDNLSPLPGSRKKRTRKGRGHAAGQGATCGFGNRGQKARSGRGVRPGFEGGQMPLYRKVPKLKGIAGGMSAGRNKHVIMNLGQLNDGHFADGDVVNLETLKAKRMLKTNGRDRRLPLKILAEGDLSKPLKIEARSISDAAVEKIKAAGGTITILPAKNKSQGSKKKGNKRSRFSETSKIERLSKGTVTA